MLSWWPKDSHCVYVQSVNLLHHSIMMINSFKQHTNELCIYPRYIRTAMTTIIALIDAALCADAIWLSVLVFSPLKTGRGAFCFSADSALVKIFSASKSRDFIVWSSYTHAHIEIYPSNMVGLWCSIQSVQGLYILGFLILGNVKILRSLQVSTHPPVKRDFFF